MPAGGTWISQNKVRPGAYINVVGVPKPLGSIGDRGIVAIPMVLGWGEKLITLPVNEFLTGGGLLKVGADYTDSSDVAKQLRLAFQGAATVVIRRIDANATKASANLLKASATAKYGGTFGNNISVVVSLKTVTEEVEGEEVTTTVGVTLETYVGGVFKGNATCTNELTLASDLSNDWIDVEGVFADFNAGTYNLSGGADGTADSWTNIFADLEQENWNVLAFPATDTVSKDAAVNFIRAMRDDSGIKVQAVLTECSGQDSSGYTFTAYSPDYEGIYVCKQGYRLSDATVVSPIDAVYMLAGLVAGATITQSLTGTVVQNAVEILHAPKTHEAIIEAIETGKLVFSKRRDGAIVIEYDVNSFTSLTAKKGKVFTKGRPMRVLDNIANDIKLLFDKSYLGKVSNNGNGRDIFKGNLIKYFRDLEALEAIQNFDSDADVEVLPGDDIDSVVVNCWVQPVDSMEKLYMTVNVEG
ncbi:MAG: phage tail sheath subtilisin-like domain-containing protein [Proteobacteria bacterium]|nr:phage tail sheath subtilisin-like domain-containing protein [Pseudomonadota bacterium]